MNIIVDTCVWSASLRRKAAGDESCALELSKLIRQFRARLIGPIRQELLSGVRDATQYARLKENLRAFENGTILPEDYERAAEMFNYCRSKGVQGSNTDFLICAVAERERCAIFTVDRDFDYFERHIQVRLHRS